MYARREQARCARFKSPECKNTSPRARFVVVIKNENGFHALTRPSALFAISDSRFVNREKSALPRPTMRYARDFDRWAVSATRRFDEFVAGDAANTRRHIGASRYRLLELRASLREIRRVSSVMLQWQRRIATFNHRRPMMRKCAADAPTLIKRGKKRVSRRGPFNQSAERFFALRRLASEIYNCRLNEHSPS